MNAELAEALRDIVTPMAPPVWPPAPGWWLAASALAVLLIWSWRSLPTWYQRRRRRRAALRALADLRLRHRSGEPGETLLRELSALLKRVALSRFPAAQVAALHGEAWLEFLDKAAADSVQFKREGRALIEGPYQCHPSADLGPLLRLSTTWIRAVV